MNAVLAFATSAFIALGDAVTSDAAESPRLRIARATWFDGWINNVLARPDGTLVVSGDFHDGVSPAGGATLKPQICVLDPDGRPIQRFVAPAITAGPDTVSLRWQVRAVFPDGSLLV